MGIAIFITAAIIEIALAAFCMLTNSTQQRTRNLIRIVAFVAFVLLTVSSVIQWSMRYYSLAAFLFLLAFTATVELTWKRQKRRTFRRGRLVAETISMILLIFLVTLPSIVFPQHQGIKPTGQYPVATVTYTYQDKNRIDTYHPSRNREVNVELWYPQTANARVPLIVFSPGAFGIKTSNKTLFNELASHGYVVCSIDHPYQSLYTTDKAGHTVLASMAYMKELQNVDPENNKNQAYEDYQKWMKIRTDDINAVIDKILAQSQSKTADAVYQLVDPTRIGVMGHSLGGSAALGIGRMRNDVSAVVALESPFLCDIQGVTDDKFNFVSAAYPVPVLNIYSDSAWGHLSQWPEYAENYQLLSNPTPTSYDVHIQGVGHFTLTDLALTSPILTRLLNGQPSTTSTEYSLKVINQVCLNFFDTYLKGKGKLTAGLQSDG